METGIRLSATSGATIAPVCFGLAMFRAGWRLPQLLERCGPRGVGTFAEAGCCTAPRGDDGGLWFDPGTNDPGTIGGAGGAPAATEAPFRGVGPAGGVNDEGIAMRGGDAAMMCMGPCAGSICCEAPLTGEVARGVIVTTLGDVPRSRADGIVICPKLSIRALLGGRTPLIDVALHAAAKPQVRRRLPVLCDFGRPDAQLDEETDACFAHEDGTSIAGNSAESGLVG